jgi:hypothetical protein
MTAIRCYNDRQNDNAGKSAFAHLQMLTGNPGIEVLMQAGMLADAADEGMAFTRFNDRESCDTSLLLAESTAFLAKIKVLFVDGKALDMGSEGLIQTPTCLQTMVINRRKSLLFDVSAV